MNTPDNKVMRKSILYLSYDGLADPIGQSQVLPYLIGLSRFGHRITLITFEKKRKGNLFRQLQKKVNESGIQWIPQQYHKWPPVFSTLFDLLILMRIISRLQKKKYFSIIHCRSYITSLAGYRHKKKYNSSFIFDMRGFWADERIEGGIWNPRNPFYRIIYQYFKKKEIHFLERADHIIVLTENAKNEINSILAKNNLNAKISLNISVIPTCVDTKAFNPNKITNNELIPLRQKLNITKNTFVLIYAGSLGTWYMVDEMLDFYSHISKVYSDSVFLILTKDLNQLLTKVKERGYQPGDVYHMNDKTDHPNISKFLLFNHCSPGNFRNQIIVTFIGNSKVPFYLSLANASICFIKPTFSKTGSSATKIWESVAMGVPVISNTGWGDIKKYFKEFSIGYLVSNFNNEEYSRVVDKLKEDKKSGKPEFPESLKNRISLATAIELYNNIYVALTK